MSLWKRTMDYLGLGPDDAVVALMTRLIDPDSLDADTAWEWWLWDGESDIGAATPAMIRRRPFLIVLTGFAFARWIVT